MFLDATIGIIVANENGEIQLANKLAASLFGYDEGELLNHTIEILIPKKVRSKHHSHRENFHKQPKPRIMGEGSELEGLRKDGSTFPLEISLSPLNVDGEKLVIAYVNDITNRVKVKQALQESEMRFRNIVNKLPVGALIIQEDKLEINGAVENITGYGSKEIDSIKEWFEQLSGNDFETNWNNYQQDLRSGFQEIREISIIRKDGTECWIKFQGYQFNQGVVLLINDITKTRSAEKVLEENRLRLENYAIDLERAVHLKTRQLAVSAQKLEQASSLSKIGYWEIDFSEGKSQITFSKEYCELYGVEEDAPGQNKEYFLQFIEGEERAQVVQNTKNAIKKGSGKFHYKATNKSGKEIYFQAELKCYYDRFGELETVFCVVQDISEQKKAELQLETSLARERELGQLKSRFVSMASHEFRTPLTSILSSVSLIEMLNAKGKLAGQEKYIKRIENSVDNLTSILNDFLSLEKLESGNITIQPKEVLLKDFFEELKDDISANLKEHQALVFNHDGIDSAIFDPHLMKNILLNLISNAIKYSAKGSTVTVTLELSEKDLKIEVVDQGVGIPVEDQKYMFTRFFRANNVTNIKGTGLGLTIVKRYLDLMHGEINFTSIENEGSTFSLVIPRKTP